MVQIILPKKDGEPNQFVFRSWFTVTILNVTAPATALETFAEGLSAFIPGLPSIQWTWR